MRVGKEHFAQEKMELTDQIQEVKTRLERLRSEQDSKISKLSMEKKLYQDRLHDSEAQQLMLKLQKNDEMKVLHVFQGFCFSRKISSSLLFPKVKIVLFCCCLG